MKLRNLFIIALAVGALACSKSEEQSGGASGSSSQKQVREPRTYALADGTVFVEPGANSVSVVTDDKGNEVVTVQLSAADAGRLYAMLSQRDSDGDLRAREIETKDAEGKNKQLVYRFGNGWAADQTDVADVAKADAKADEQPAREAIVTLNVNENSGSVVIVTGNAFKKGATHSSRGFEPKELAEGTIDIQYADAFVEQNSSEAKELGAALFDPTNTAMKTSYTTQDDAGGLTIVSKRDKNGHFASVRLTIRWIDGASAPVVKTEKTDSKNSDSK